MNQGKIFVSRDLPLHWIWQSPKRCQRWLDMLFMASWEMQVTVFRGKKFAVKRGQFITSIRTLMSKWQTNAKTVLMFLQMLESNHMIDVEKSADGTRISIKDYEINRQIGFICLSRAIQQHWIWDSPRLSQQWLIMLFMASWESKTVIANGKKVNIERGEFTTSARKLMAMWRATEKEVRTFLDMLEADDMIRVQHKAGNLIISIVNYEAYQNTEETIFSEQTKLFQMSYEVNENNKNTTEEKLNELKRKEKYTKEKKDKQFNSHITARAHTREEEFFENMKSSRLYIEQCAKSQSCSEEDIMLLLEKFQNECAAKENAHRDLQDAKRHFFDWLKYQKNNYSNGTNNFNSSNRADARTERQKQYVEAIAILASKS